MLLPPLNIFILYGMHSNNGGLENQADQAPQTVREGRINERRQK